MSETENITTHENCGSTKWTCTECKFKTFCDVEALKHEHKYLNAEISLTDKQIERCFGITKETNGRVEK